MSGFFFYTNAFRSDDGFNTVYDEWGGVWGPSLYDLSMGVFSFFLFLVPASITLPRGRRACRSRRVEPWRGTYHPLPEVIYIYIYLYTVNTVRILKYRYTSNLGSGHETPSIEGTDKKITFFFFTSRRPPLDPGDEYINSSVQPPPPFLLSPPLPHYPPFPRKNKRENRSMDDNVTKILEN